MGFSFEHKQGTNISSISITCSAENSLLGVSEHHLGYIYISLF